MDLLTQILMWRQVDFTHFSFVTWVGFDVDCGIFLYSNYTSGQIIATSDDLTPNGGLAREIPLFQGNLGW